jgi:hypothetical protein
VNTPSGTTARRDDEHAAHNDDHHDRPDVREDVLCEVVDRSEEDDHHVQMGDLQQGEHTRHDDPVIFLADHEQDEQPDNEEDLDGDGQPASHQTTSGVGLGAAATGHKVSGDGSLGHEYTRRLLGQRVGCPAALA